MSKFKQEFFNYIDDKHISRIFCDESCHTDIVFKEPVVFSKKVANRISLHTSPNTKKYVLKSYLWLPNFNHLIFKETSSYTTKEELISELKKINRMIETG